MLNEASTISKHVHSPLVTIIYLVLPDGWITVGCDPDPSILVGMYLVLYELPHAVLVDVYAPRLAVVYLAVDHSGVSVSLHLKPGNAVIVDVV